jgi:hypothetical protein
MGNQEKGGKEKYKSQNFLLRFVNWLDGIPAVSRDPHVWKK